MASKKQNKLKVEQSVESGNSDNSEESENKLTLQEKCKKYYKESRKKYNEFFVKCLEEIEELQPSGFACIQVNRNFTVGVLPKFCTIPDPLTRNERQRVERILAD